MRVYTVSNDMDCVIFKGLGDAISYLEIEVEFFESENGVWEFKAEEMSESVFESLGEFDG